MSEARQDGGSAFPVAGWAMGMTLRDYFAGKALQGLVACDAFHGPLYQQQWQAAADFAYGQADAMLAERAKGTQ